MTMQTGRAQKGRGYRSEKRVEALLEPYQFQRVWCSGALGKHNESLRGDLRYTGPSQRDSPAPAITQVEVKRWKGGLRFIRAALKQDDADALVVDPGGASDGMVVAMSIKTFLRLLDEACYDERA